MNRKVFWAILVLTAVVYALGVQVNIMDIDAAQYAAISREMLASGSYLEVYEQGKDYLDKPPLLFWLSSLSMAIFGSNNLGYKLPAILGALLAVYSTYRFARLFYAESVAKWSAIVLATTQALFLITNDVRTDTLLMAFTIFAMWHLTEGLQTNRKLSFLYGFVGLSLGMMAKGPVAVVIPAMAFTVHFLAQKTYRQFLRWEYLWGVAVMLVLLIPMCIGLYNQFDLHPEKVMYERSGTSGLRFFFWTQSFGRITGENVWRNNVYFSFLFENMLWSFAPWILFFIGGFVATIIRIFRPNKSFDNPEFITIGGFILGYISLATSKYQLPHYIFVVYPFAAVITARFIDLLFVRKKWILWRSVFAGLQWLVMGVLWFLPILILTIVFPTDSWLPLSSLVLFGVGALYLVYVRRNVLYFSIYTTLVVNVFASSYFYPNLLTYQKGSEVGTLVKKMNVPDDRFFTFHHHGTSSLHFYSQRVVAKKDDITAVRSGDWLLTGENGLDLLKQNRLAFEVVKAGGSFPVTGLTAKFLNPQTRPETLEKYYLVKIQ